VKITVVTQKPKFLYFFSPTLYYFTRGGVWMSGQDRRVDSGPTFYQNLNSFDDFSEVSDLPRYTPAPGDWLVVIADIKGSTQAISDGRYKDVNMIGAACITAVLNVTRDHEIPYVFGGDGATLMIPPGALPRVREALLKTQRLAQANFALTLRVGAVPVENVRSETIDVLAAKFCLSPGNYLATFTGGGVGLVDKLIKQDDGTNGYVMQDTPSEDLPDLDGLSCRWEPLAAKRGIMLSMLIQAMARDREGVANTYHEIISTLTKALGQEIETYRPVKSEALKFRWPPRGLKAEARASANDGNYYIRLFSLYWESLIQCFLDRFKLQAGSYNAPAYRKELQTNSDYRRFDDTLRMVLDCTRSDVSAIEQTLEQFRQKGKITYGLHEADSALMTCLVFNLSDSEHVHFIDGSDGGFAIAAKQLKQQLAER
jgi:hypothetical protein